jgi:putative SOS response-associated peptidase YedK
MCGRYNLYSNRGKSPLVILDHEIEPMFNIAPVQFVPIITVDDGDWRLHKSRWGLMPAWAKDIHKTKPYFNARAENLEHNRVFGSSTARRCLIPMSGFYEWPQQDTRQPWYFQLADTELFYCGGLWRDWEYEEGKTLRSFAMLTTGAHPVVQTIHDRMPVIIDPADHEQWLTADLPEVQHLMASYPGKMTSYRVDPDVVNNSRNKSLACIARLAGEDRE